MRGIISRKPSSKSAHDFLGLLYCFIVLLCICVVSCPYVVIYYPTDMARYSLFLLKVPLNSKQTNKQTLQQGWKRARERTRVFSHTEKQRANERRCRCRCRRRSDRSRDAELVRLTLKNGSSTWPRLQMSRTRSPIYTARAPPCHRLAAAAGQFGHVADRGPPGSLTYR